MARNLTTFLQSLLKNITTYYTATYSSDTDLYSILQMYGAELASGSTTLETVRNNLFIVTCEDAKLTDNFGTYFDQLKYSNQDYNEDRYISTITEWAKSGSVLHQRYSQLDYDHPFGLVSFTTPLITNNPWSFSVVTGPNTDVGRIPYVSTTFSGSIIFAFRGQPIEYENPYQNVYSPWRLSTYNPVLNEWRPLTAQYDVTAGAVYIYGLISYAPYLGHAQYTDERLWAWDVFVTTISGGPSDTNPRIRLYEYNGDYVQTIHDSTTATITLPHVLNPITYGWNATDKSVVFHDKIYVGWSHNNSEPHLISYDSITDAFVDHGLNAYASGSIASSGSTATTFNIHNPIVVHDNKVMIEVDYTSDIPITGNKIFAFDSTNWSMLDAPSNSINSNKFIDFNGTLYALTGDSVMVYDDFSGSWATHTSFNGLYPRDIFVFQNNLIVSVSYGTVYRLTANNQFVEFDQLDNSIKDSLSLFVELSNAVYGYYQNGWYSSSFSSITEWSEFWPAPHATGTAIQNVSIPGYRKQLEFMLEAAVNGGTHKGITRMVNAFTLINPDIREIYTLPQWKLTNKTYNVTQLSSNTWQFSGAPNFRTNLFAGAHVTFVSGSTPQDKVAAAYLVLVNDNDSVTVGAIEDKRLLMQIVRPS